jgi:type I restriction enzyme R subunit
VKNDVGPFFCHCFGNFKAYATDSRVRSVIDSKRFTEFYTSSSFAMADFKAVPLEYRMLIPEYIKDYVPLNQFLA